jgi:hypothetical protein
MNRPAWGLLLLLSLMVAVSGCADSKSDTESKGDQPAAGDATAGDATKSAETVHLLSENVPKRTSLEGRWILLFYERMTFMESPVALLEISKSTKDPANLRVLVKGFGSMLQSPRIKQAAVTRNTLRLGLEMTVQTIANGRPGAPQTKPLEVLVQLRDGYARGSADYTPMDGFPVMMVPTELDSIQSLQPQRLPEAIELQGSKDTTAEQAIQKLTTFLKSHPESPLTVEMYPFIFRAAPDRQLDAATLNAEADKFAAMAGHWSPRLEFKARVEVAAVLGTIGYMPEVCLKQIDIDMAKLTEETIPIWKGMLTEMRTGIVSTQALSQITSGSPAEKAKSAEILRATDKEHPYNPVVTFKLAQYDQGRGKKQEALQAFAAAAVLPMYEPVLDEMLKNESPKPAPAKEYAQALWKELHGGKLDGFDAYLDKVYDESMPKGNIKPVEPRSQEPDNRVVLCELFTGVNCSVCVAADVAFSHLLKTYRPSEVIALQYHQHIPQPDPLTNSDSEQRFHYYFPERGGTPTFTVAGGPAQRGGYLSAAKDVYNSIREMINVMLQRKTSVHIHLKAEPKESAVAVSADAEGSFSPTDPVRLRLVLAEERVGMRGSNGIREHEMVVRSMPGGPAGVELKDGKLKYEGTIDLKVVKRQLDDYLRAFEESQKMTFPKKPLALTHLHLVAFVQNDQTKEIYQAATIPFPSGPAPAAASKTQAANEKSKAAGGVVSKATP